MPVSACRWRIRVRICACTVTSSAVVGSSAISMSGCRPSAMAIITRWRMPPESSCGYCVSRRAASGICTRSSSARAPRRVRPGRRAPAWARDRLGQLPADGQHRVERGHRLLEDHADVAAAHRRASRLRRAPSRSRPLNSTCRAVTRAIGSGSRPHDRQRGHRLAGAALAGDAQRLAAAEVEATVDRRPRAAPAGVATDVVNCRTDRSGWSKPCAPFQTRDTYRGRPWSPPMAYYRRRCAGSRRRPPSSACRRSR